MQSSRRKFLGTMSVMAAAAANARMLEALAPRGPAWSMKLGYASMTWGNEERQAIDDIASLGYAGIQFRSNAVTEFKPEELHALLAQKKLQFVALSSGELKTAAVDRADQLQLHTENAKYVRAAGGKYLQVLDALAPYPRSVTAQECRDLGAMLTEIGKRVADQGVQLGYHNHMNTIGQRPDDVRRVMDASDPKYVGLELDTAHWVAGGGDPAPAIEEFRARLLFLHLKDVVDAPMDGKAKYPFKFVELGKGRVDFPRVFDALRKTRFEGWSVVELDRVPDRASTPKQCAATSAAFLEAKLPGSVHPGEAS